MSRIAAFCALTFLLAGPASAGEAPVSPVGRWKTIDDETGNAKSIIRIYEEGGKVHGKIEKVIYQPGEPQRTHCDKCPDERKDKPLVGMVIMNGFTWDGSEWSGGRILDPQSGKIYRCLIRVMDDGKKLKVRGYIGISLLGRTQYWYREPDEAPQAAPEPAKPAEPQPGQPAQPVPEQAKPAEPQKAP